MEETVNGVQNNTAYGYDMLNRLASVDSTKGNNDSYSYDFRGNMASSFEAEDYLSEDAVAYDYDELNRLYHVNKGGAHTYFDYTADGYRFVKKASGGTTFYVYDQRGRLCAEVKAVTNGTVNFLATVASYVWGSDRVLAKLDKLSEKRYYYLYNGHGDVVQVLDTSGSIANSYDYNVWGNFITKNETIHNPFTYFCQTYDESTGLYYLRARYYDPATGRFTQEDPANDGLNWYIYGNNNPIFWIDPSGKAVDPSQNLWNQYMMWANTKNYELAESQLYGLELGYMSLYGFKSVEEVYYEMNYLHYQNQKIRGGVDTYDYTHGGKVWGYIPKTSIIETVTNQMLSASMMSSSLKIKGGEIASGAVEAIMKKWGARGVAAFEKAANKGLVGPRAEAGIKKLSSAIKGFTHEIKVMNKEFGDYRIFGKLNDAGEWIFELFTKGKH